MRILVAQGNNKEGKRLESRFTAESYIVDLASTAEETLRLCGQHDHDVIVLGYKLPDRDGVAVCRQMRREGMGTPVIMLASIDDTEPAVDSLDAGADDYVAKPVEFEELVARVRAMVRRCQAEEGSVLRYEGIEVDVANRNVVVNERPVVLTPREFALLEYLLRNRERVVSRNALGDRVWGLEYGEENSNVVDVYVSRLRRKLQAVDKPLIQTVHGRGYMLASSPLAE